MRGIDLFCGAGGLSAGLQKAGIDVVAAYDDWLLAVDVYNRNLPSHAEQFDLCDTAKAAREVASHNPDIIVGGPPCQDFSTAGNRVEDRQANLTVAFALIVSECRPSFVLMENVPQVRRSAAYRRMKEILNECGYIFAELVLDASRYGVPQARKRFFSLGTLEGEDICNYFLSRLHTCGDDNRLTVKEYMDDEIDVEFYYRHPRNYSRRSVFTVHEPSPTIRGVNRPVPPNYAGNHLDSAPPSEVRPLYSWERSRIQTFPAGWKWPNGDRNADTELLIGNAVPVNLAAFVGEGLRYAVN